MYVGRARSLVVMLVNAMVAWCINEFVLVHGESGSWR